MLSKRLSGFSYILHVTIKSARARTWELNSHIPSYLLIFLCSQCHKWIIFPALKLNRHVLREITSYFRGHQVPMFVVTLFCNFFRENWNFQIPRREWKCVLLSVVLSERRVIFVLKLSGYDTDTGRHKSTSSLFSFHTERKRATSGESVVLWT